MVKRPKTWTASHGAWWSAFAVGSPGTVVVRKEASFVFWGMACLLPVSSISPCLMASSAELSLPFPSCQASKLHNVNMQNNSLLDTCGCSLNNLTPKCPKGFSISADPLYNASLAFKRHLVFLRKCWCFSDSYWCTSDRNYSKYSRCNIMFSNGQYVTCL